MQNAINKLKYGKTCENGELSAERYVKYILLTFFYNRVFSHGLDDFITTIIIQLTQGSVIKQLSILQYL